MQTNNTAILTAILGLLVLILQAVFPDLATPIGNLQSPVFDLLVAILWGVAGLNTATNSQVTKAQKAV